MKRKPVYVYTADGNKINLWNKDELRPYCTGPYIQSRLMVLKRWGPLCDQFNDTVWKHSLRMADKFMPGIEYKEYVDFGLSLGRAILYHDAAEAFTSDLLSTIKVLSPEIQALERHIQETVFECLGIPVEYIDHPLIKQLDKADYEQALNTWLSTRSQKTP